MYRVWRALCTSTSLTYKIEYMKWQPRLEGFRDFWKKKLCKFFCLWLGTHAINRWEFKLYWNRKSNKYAGLASWKRPTSPDPEFFGFEWPSSAEVLLLDLATKWSSYYIASIYIISCWIYKTTFCFSEVSRNTSLKSYRQLRLFSITDKIWILMNTSSREVVWWMTIMCTTVLISDKLLTSTCHRGLKLIRQVLNLHAITLRQYIYNCPDIMM